MFWTERVRSCNPPSAEILRDRKIINFFSSLLLFCMKSKESVDWMMILLSGRMVWRDVKTRLWLLNGLFGSCRVCDELIISKNVCESATTSKEKVEIKQKFRWDDDECDDDGKTSPISSSYRWHHHHVDVKWKKCWIQNSSSMTEISVCDCWVDFPLFAVIPHMF